MARPRKLTNEPLPQRDEAETDTGLLDLPAECPWAVDQVINHDFWPP